MLKVQAERNNYISRIKKKKKSEKQMSLHVAQNIPH